jgi:hypothetical protein
VFGAGVLVYVAAYGIFAAGPHSWPVSLSP